MTTTEMRSSNSWTFGISSVLNLVLVGLLVFVYLTQPLALWKLREMETLDPSIESQLQSMTKSELKAELQLSLLEIAKLREQWSSVFHEYSYEQAPKKFEELLTLVEASNNQTHACLSSHQPSFGPEQETFILSLMNSMNVFVKHILTLEREIYWLQQQVRQLARMVSLDIDHPQFPMCVVIWCGCVWLDTVVIG